MPFKFKGDDKTGSYTWKLRCLVEKFEADRNDFTKRLGQLTGDPHAFCDELERRTGGIVHHETRETSPELFSNPTTQHPKGKKTSVPEQQGKRKDSAQDEPGPSKPRKDSVPEDQAPSKSLAVKPRKRKGAAQEEQGPSKRHKEDSQMADIEAEVQAHYIGKKICQY